MAAAHLKGGGNCVVTIGREFVTEPMAFKQGAQRKYHRSQIYTGARF